MKTSSEKLFGLTDPILQLTVCLFYYECIPVNNSATKTIFPIPVTAVGVYIIPLNSLLKNIYLIYYFLASTI